MAVDFGEQERLPDWFKRLLLAWLAKFHVAPRAELPSVLAALASSSGAELTITPLYRDYARFAELAR
jgi:S-adenosylmethionine-diacylgycerolhomoserine-N-methlytransferase